MTKEEFYPLVTKLVDEVTIVETNRLTYKRLTELCGKGKECEIAFRHANTFWTLMIINITDQIIAGLARLYDSTRQAICLQKLINLCEQNKQIFPPLCDAPNWDNNELEQVQVSNLLRTMQAEYNRVDVERKKIKIIRDKVSSHIDKEYILDGSLLYKDLAWSEIEDLIDAAQKILTYIMIAVYNQSAVFALADLDDIDWLLKMTLYGYNCKKAEWESLLECDE